MITLLISILFFDLTFHGLTVTNAIQWFNFHPFLALMLIGEVFSYKVIIQTRK